MRLSPPGWPHTTIGHTSLVCRLSSLCDFAIFIQTGCFEGVAGGIFQIANIVPSVIK